MMKQIPTFEDEAGNRVVFVPHWRHDSTHHVRVNNTLVGFLPHTHKPTSVAAEFFCNKYRRLGGMR